MVGVSRPEGLPREHLINIVYVQGKDNSYQTFHASVELTWHSMVWPLSSFSTANMHSHRTGSQEYYQRLTGCNERLSDESTLVLNDGNLAVGVNLVQVPLRLHFQMDVDLFCSDVLGCCNQAHTLQMIHIVGQTGKQKGRQADRQTDRQADTLPQMQHTCAKGQIGLL